MPGADQPHCFLTVRTKGCQSDRNAFGGWDFEVVWVRGWIPGLFFGRAEQRVLAQQSPDAIGTNFGGRMQPAKGAYPSKAARQDVLEKAPDKVQRRQLEGSKFSGFAFAIVPAQPSIGQLWNHAVGSGGLEDITGEVTQRVLP